MFIQPWKAKVIIFVRLLAFEHNATVPALLPKALRNLAPSLQISVRR